MTGVDKHTGTQFAKTKKRLRAGYILAFGLVLLFGVGTYALWWSFSRISELGAQNFALLLLFAGLGGIAVWALVSLLRSAHHAILSAEHIILVLQKSKERYELSFAGSSEGMWDRDMTTDTLYVSPRWKKMLGFDEEGAPDTVESWLERIHPEDREAVESALNRHLEGISPQYAAEYRIKNKHNVYVWLADHGRAIRDDNGNTIRLSGSSRDISNLKRVEEVLRGRTAELERAKTRIEEEARNARKFQRAVEAATDAIGIMEPDGTLVYVNPAWERLTGFSQKESEGAKFVDIYSEHTPHAVLENMWEALANGKSFESEEVEGVRRDGSTYQAALSVFPLMENGKAVFYTATQQDITKRKEVDEAKTEFVSLASHQLRTPLSTIRWYVEMLLGGNEGELTKTQEKYLQEVYDANKNMIELVGALLNVSRIDLGKFSIEPKPTNLPSVCDDVLKETGPLIEERNTQVSKTYDPDIPSVDVDPALMRIVFQNLISNAVKYTPEGGSVRIIIARKDPNIEFSVADDGYGIPPHQQDKIFTKLFRADNVRERDPSGTGLGLYIVKAIMEKSGGTIRFASPTIPGDNGEEGRGTTFYGTIPLSGSPQRGGTKRLDIEPL